jgi:ATP-binding cassette subfamily B protein
VRSASYLFSKFKNKALEKTDKLLSILTLANNYKYLVLKSLISLVTQSFCLLSIGNEIRELIDHGLHSNNLEFLNIKAIKIILLITIFSAASFFRANTVTQLSNRIIYDLRSKAYANLLKLKIEYYEETSAAQIQLKIVEDSRSVSVIIQEVFSFLIRNIILFISSLVLMYYQSKMLFVLTSIVVVIICLPLIFFIKISKSLVSKQQKPLNKIAELIIETVQNIKLIYGYNLQNYSKEIFNAASKSLEIATNQSNRIRSIFFSCVIGFICISITLIIWAGSYQILNGGITSGKLIAFMIYAIMSVSSLIGILNNTSEIQPQLSKLYKILDLINDNNYEDNIFRVRSLTKEIDIRFDEVEFAYPSRKDIKILNKFNEHIKFGEFVAISGKSGVGKSTLLYLLLKFYSPQNGLITVNNNSLSTICTSLIRGNFIFTNQDPLILSTSILENITLGRNYTKANLDQVIHICGLESLLTYLPEGLETSVGHNGFKISGGQKQRICIARSLLSQPKILMLDEATSALDSESENQILQNIKAMKDKTIIFISHSNKIIQLADRVIPIN